MKTRRGKWKSLGIQQGKRLHHFRSRANHKLVQKLMGFEGSWQCRSGLSTLSDWSQNCYKIIYDISKSASPQRLKTKTGSSKYNYVYCSAASQKNLLISRVVKLILYLSEHTK